MKIRKAEIIIIAVFVCVAIAAGVLMFKANTAMTPVTAMDDIAEPTITKIEPTGIYELLDTKVNIGNIRPGDIADDMEMVIVNGYTNELNVIVDTVIPDRVTTDIATMLKYQPAPLDAQKWIVRGRQKVVDTISVTTGSGQTKASVKLSRPVDGKIEIINASDYKVIDKSTIEIHGLVPNTKSFVTLTYYALDVVIPPASIMSIPVRLVIPKDAKSLPDRWEIDLRVSEGAGFLTRAYLQRYLISMR